MLQHWILRNLLHHIMKALGYLNAFKVALYSDWSDDSRVYIILYYIYLYYIIFPFLIR